MTDKPIDWTKPVEYFDAHRVKPVRVLCTDGPNETYPVAFWAGGVRPEVCTLDGRIAADGAVRFRNTVEKAVRYLNVNNLGGVLYIAGNYSTAEEASYAAGRSRVSCLRVELVGGQFDD